ncbi:MAG: efflux RND transporter periplasmic adaptor subunit [Rhizobium tropici]|nr:efflux RND transporter periplasmic adaptor subunit [Rhizobium tropici]
MQKDDGQTFAITGRFCCLTTSNPGRRVQGMMNMAELQRSSRLKSPKALIACILIVGIAGTVWAKRASIEAELTGPDHSVANGGAKPAQDAGVPVTLASARSQDFLVNLDELGTVQALNTVTVHSQITGRIAKVDFTQGHMVNKGAPLVEIDPQSYEAALAQAKGQLARDQALLKGAQVDLDRDSKLATQHAASQQTLDDQAALVAQDQGTVQADQAAVQAASVNLAYCRIAAPFTGRVGFSLIDVGNLVQPTDTTGIVTIAQVQPISVVFPAPQDQLQAVTKALASGDVPVEVISEDGKTVLSQGTLSYIDNQINVATGTINLKATFANADDALWPGQSVTVRLGVSTLKNVVQIPLDAVQHGPDGLFAYIVGPDRKAQVRPIKVSETGNGSVVVSDGVKPGETVVTDGSYRVQPGSLVADVRQQVATDASPATAIASP